MVLQDDTRKLVAIDRVIAFCFCLDGLEVTPQFREGDDNIDRGFLQNSLTISNSTGTIAMKGNLKTTTYVPLCFDLGICISIIMILSLNFGYQLT